MASYLTSPFMLVSPVSILNTVATITLGNMSNHFGPYLIQNKSQSPHSGLMVCLPWLLLPATLASMLWHQACSHFRAFDLAVLCAYSTFPPDHTLTYFRSLLNCHLIRHYYPQPDGPCSTHHNLSYSLLYFFVPTREFNESRDFVLFTVLPQAPRTGSGIQ